MISWWWLAIEAAVFVFWGTRVRGMARSCALADALINPIGARAELRARFGPNLTDADLDHVIAMLGDGWPWPRPRHE